MRLIRLFLFRVWTSGRLDHHLTDDDPNQQERERKVPLRVAINRRTLDPTLPLFPNPVASHDEAFWGKALRDCMFLLSYRG